MDGRHHRDLRRGGPVPQSNAGLAENRCGQCSCSADLCVGSVAPPLRIACRRPGPLAGAPNGRIRMAYLVQVSLNTSPQRSAARLRLSNGSRVASLGSFPGGLHGPARVWSRNGEYLAFRDEAGDIRFSNPLQLDLFGGGCTQRIRLRDGSRLTANFRVGVKVFDVVPPP